MDISGPLHDPTALLPVGIDHEAGWAPELVWHFGEEKHILPLPGFEPQTVQPEA
jgi:hypothetical protein